jgi:hypothetical protein
MQLAQVAATGGSKAINPTRFAILQVVGVNPEGSSLLALVGSIVENPAVWRIPLGTPAASSAIVSPPSLPGIKADVDQLRSRHFTHPCRKDMEQPLLMIG